MIEFSCVHLKSLPFSSFSQLMEVLRKTNESAKGIARSSWLVKPSLKEATLVATMEMNSGARGFSLNKGAY